MTTPADEAEAALDPSIDVNRRDTDSDWRFIGAEQPYWGVLTQPEYRAEAMTPEALAAFYETGRADVEMFADLVRRASDVAPAGGRALDFGCGVGRLSEALTEYCDEVVGVDISPGMLEKARARSGKVDYVEALPDGAFDWITSHIVFQHIPSARGLAILDQLLARLAPGGAISLQFPFARSHLKPAPTDVDPLGTMHMFDYDLKVIFSKLTERGVQRMLLHPTDHGDHYGFMICGRRKAA